MTQLISYSLCCGCHCHHCAILGLQFPPKVHQQQDRLLIKRDLSFNWSAWGNTGCVCVLPANRYHMACTKCVVQTLIVLVVFQHCEINYSSAFVASLH